MAKIAIVGTRESGKTVLMTVLAKRYQTRNGDEPFLKAMNPQTMAFTEKNWHRLTVERDWPPLTPPGELLKLHWSLECGGQSHEIHLVDFAGETFRTVFGKHTLTDPQVRSQLGGDPLYGPLLAYLDQADVVVLLVNLRDYVNAPPTAGGMDLMLENQWALRGSLDYLAPRLKNHVAAVFTQIDQYAELVNNRKSWRDVMREHLPATQIADIYPDLTCLGVSAITETELDASPGGEPFQRPAVNFQSWHLEELLSFLQESCTMIKANQEAKLAAMSYTSGAFARAFAKLRSKPIYWQIAVAVAVAAMVVLVLKEGYSARTQATLARAAAAEKTEQEKAAVQLRTAAEAKAREEQEAQLKERQQTAAKQQADEELVRQRTERDRLMAENKRKADEFAARQALALQRAESDRQMAENKQKADERAALFARQEEHLRIQETLIVADVTFIQAPQVEDAAVRLKLLKEAHALYLKVQKGLQQLKLDDRDLRPNYVTARIEEVSRLLTLEMR